MWSCHIFLTKFHAFLGQVNYYTKFVPCLSSILAPPHRLLKAGQPWEWSKRLGAGLPSSQGQNLRIPSTCPFWPTTATLVGSRCIPIWSGSSYLSYARWQRAAIAYASRTLSEAKKKYTQVEKEALSLVFGVSKFHQYLYGRMFTLITDHKPLTTILGPKHGIPPLAAARMYGTRFTSITDH